MDTADRRTPQADSRGLTRRDVLLVSAQATAALALARCGGGAGGYSSLGGGTGSAPPYAVKGEVHAVDASGTDHALEPLAHSLSRLETDGSVAWAQVGGPLNGPSQAAFDSRGAIYVANLGGHDVPVFDPEGGHVRTLGAPGGDPGCFRYPSDVLVDAQDRVFVCDSLNHRVQVLDAQGRVQGVIGTPGDEPEALNAPKAIALDPEGYLHVVDGGNARVQVFDTAGRHVASYGTYGSGDAELRIPRDIAIDPYGRVYVVDVGRGEVLVFERSGQEGGTAFRPEDASGARIAPLRVSLDAESELVVTGHPFAV